MIDLFEGFSFIFENDFQKLQVLARVRDGFIDYIIPVSHNVDFIPTISLWTTYPGDSQSLINDFASLNISDWESSNCCSKPAEIPLCKLDVCNSTGAILKSISMDGGRYHSDFVDFLNLLKELLNIPILLLEL